MFFPKSITQDPKFMHVFEALKALGSPMDVMPYVAILLVVVAEGDDEKFDKLIASMRDAHNEVKATR